MRKNIIKLLSPPLVILLIFTMMFVMIPSQQKDASAASGTKTVTITKQWNDSLTASAANNRTAPEITIEEAEPEHPAKYAVQILGIEADQVASSAPTYDTTTRNATTTPSTSTAGLTFGPATGANYVQSYKSHTPSGNTSNGHAHRCIHDDDWNTIIQWNHDDPYVYEQCVSECCTHSVVLDLDATTTVTNKNYNTTSETGDGPGALFYELTPTVFENLRWHPNNNRPNDTGTSGTNYQGWGAARIRAMLNGADELTDTEISNYTTIASSDVNKSASIYTPSNCLLKAFPKELQNAIGYRVTKYDSVHDDNNSANLKTTYDKLWLLSSNEIATSISITWAQHPLEGSVYQRYDCLIGDWTNSGTFNDAITYYTGESQTNSGSGSSIWWWLRSSCSYYRSSALSVGRKGGVDYNTACSQGGVAPAFSLNRSATPSSGVNETSTSANWTKVDADTWTYTFTVPEDATNLKVWESSVPTGYTTSADEDHKVTVTNNAATITNTEKTATLSYNNGGHGTAPSSQTMKYTTATNAASAISATGYTFAGWKRSDNDNVISAGSQVKAANVVPSALTLTAQWTANTGTVTYHRNHSTSDTTTTTQSYTYNTTNPLASSTFSKTGYTFAGWYSQATGGTQLTSSNFKTYFPSGSGDVYAHWTANTYTISYAGMSGASHGSSHPTSATYDTAFTVNNPTKTGYIFKGWNITGMDSVTHYYGSSNPPASTTTASSLSPAKNNIYFKNLRSSSGTVTFTAQWEQIIPVPTEVNKSSRTMIILLGLTVLTVITLVIGIRKRKLRQS